MAAAVAGSSKDPWTNYELILYFVHGSRTVIPGKRPRVPPNSIVIATGAGMSSGCSVGTDFDEEVFELFNSTNIKNTITQLLHGHVSPGSLLSLFSYKAAGDELPAKMYKLDSFVQFVSFGIYYWSHTATKFVKFPKFAKWLLNEGEVSETELLNKAPKTEGKTTIHVIVSCDNVSKNEFNFFHTNIDLIGNNKMITRGATKRAEPYELSANNEYNFSPAQLRTLLSARAFANAFLTKIVNETHLKNLTNAAKQRAIDKMKKLLAPTLKDITLKNGKNPRLHNLIRAEIEAFYKDGKFNSIIDSTAENVLVESGAPVAITGGGSVSTHVLTFPPNTPPTPPPPPNMPSRRYEPEWFPNVEEYGFENTKTGEMFFSLNELYKAAKNNSDDEEDDEDNEENDEASSTEEANEEVKQPSVKYQRTGSAYNNRSNGVATIQGTTGGGSAAASKPAAVAGSKRPRPTRRNARKLRRRRTYKK